ncbi:MAG TPA: 5-(carboxyamino)imidazole ribonucleotide synthase, partial [Pyrinomonadaceae bacterium]|nr:5-(carboxyamino)imidazole ribonucleotide synthase [Pyrinomonadaceae bacterium]
VLYITQNRLREKRFLKENALPVADFRQINLLDDLYRATGEIGFPCVLKTAGYGYDGKGQTMLREPHDIEPAFAALAGSQAVLEKFIDFEKEVSIIAVRGINGEFAHYGLIENEHRNHILDISVAPARVPESVEKDAVEIARTIAEKFEYIGTFCVEFFLSREGDLLVNEIAPRPHNSGHLTFDVCIASQFEQQVRAVCGLPLGSTRFQSPAAMANLLGDLWETGEPDWQSALAYPEVKLHLYGKSEPRPGRKMGHLTAIAETVEKSEEIVKAARRRLAAKPLAEAGR